MEIAHTKEGEGSGGGATDRERREGFFLLFISLLFLLSRVWLLLYVRCTSTTGLCGGGLWKTEGGGSFIDFRSPPPPPAIEPHSSSCLLHNHGWLLLLSGRRIFLSAKGCSFGGGKSCGRCFVPLETISFLSSPFGPSSQ